MEGLIETGHNANWETVGVHSDSDEDISGINDYQHDKFLDAISNLGSRKRVIRKQRNEPAVTTSEFHTSAGDDKIKLYELVKGLQNTSSHIGLKKQLRRVEKQEKVLTTPLPKHEQEKIERTVLYEKTCKELVQWDAVVHENRNKEQLNFPLQQTDVRLVTTDNFVKRFKPSTPLELEVAALLHGSDSILKPGKMLTQAEERALKAMSIEEAKERRAELQKHRALMSYKAAKAKRQKKIKSKQYHRIMRKEKLKNEKRTLDELEKTDPEAYLEKLQHIERQRIEERTSLKHRGGSKYMKKQALYSKYDNNARQAVQDMIKKNQELTQKILQSDEDDVVSETEEMDILHNEPSKNPWMSVKIKKKLISSKTPDEILSSEISHKSNSNANIYNNSLEINEHLKKKAGWDNSKRNYEGNNEEEGTDNEEEDTDNEEEDTDNEGDESQEIEVKKKLRPEEFRNIDDIFVSAKNLKQKEKQLEKLKKRKLTEKLIEIEEAKSKELKEKCNRPKYHHHGSSESESDSDSSDEEQSKDDNEKNSPEEGLMSSMQRKNKLEHFEGNWSAHVETEGSKQITYTPNLDSSIRNSTCDKSERPFQEKESTKEVQLDPTKFFTVDNEVIKQKKSVLVDEDTDGHTKEKEQRMTIAQAFASDDVIEEFKEEKKLIEERDKPKDINLLLPGWGDWGGSGIQPSKKKTKKFLIKAPAAKKRKDKLLNGVIISEAKDTAIVKHQVNQLPFPFTSVHDFQESIRQPVGKTWNPETSYRDMIQPSVTTKIGTIIEPIDKAEVFKDNNKKRKSTDELTFSSGNNKNVHKKMKSHQKAKGKKS